MRKLAKSVLATVLVGWVGACSSVRGDAAADVKTQDPAVVGAPVPAQGASATASTKVSPMVVQAEAAKQITGCNLIGRSNAVGRKVLHMDTSASAVLILQLEQDGEYEAIVRYSNDDSGDLDTLALFLDGQKMVSVQTEDTGDGGEGWNVFVESAPVRLGQVSRGRHELRLELENSDGWGVDVDCLTVQMQK